MAKTTLTKQVITTAGVVVSQAAANADGSDFLNSGRCILIVNNGGASPINVTVDSKSSCSQGFDHDIVVAVAAGAEKHIGPFPQARFNDASTGKADVTFSAVTSVTVALVEVP